MSTCTPCGLKKEAKGPRKVHTFGIVQLESRLRDSGSQFGDNQIITSRYTWWSFLPISLFELFHRISNITYAAISFLYLFAKGATDFYATVSPLSVAILTAMVKDAVYDIYRQRQDKAVNGRLFTTIKLNDDFTEMQLVEKKSCNLHVGDVVICTENCEFPCDMILLASSDPRLRIEVTTANLDGETTAKTHYALQKTQKAYLQLYEDCKDRGFIPISLSSLQSLLMTAECEPPNADLHTFDGRILGQQTESEGDSKSHDQNISFENIVLRGSKLVNTEFILGLPIYTGRDTKLSLNVQGARRKYTAREAKLNNILGSFVLLAITISILMAVGTLVWSSSVGISIWFLPPEKFTPWEFVQNVFSFSFITTYLLPISLIINIEFQQTILSWFISNDIEMYDEEQDLRTVAKTVHTADDLGQIEFLFSDKTGTLTENMMVLKACTTLPSNEVYKIQGNCAFQVYNWHRSSVIDTDMEPALSELSKNNEHSQTRDAPKDRSSDVSKIPSLPTDLVRPILVAVLCHSIEVKSNNRGTDATGSTPIDTGLTTVYQASSPDEKALVEASANLGYVLKSTLVDTEENVRQLKVAQRQIGKTDTTSLSWIDQDYLIDVILEFDAVRKRMTVMARHPDGTYHIHSKGAETSMLAPEASSRSTNHIRTIALERVNEFALSGLRTLVLSSRQLEAKEYTNLIKEWKSSLNLFGQQRATAMNNVRQKIESDLEIVGVTGVEDRLQPGVQECLHSLREAGIQIWVLTGDKEETAITVSQASGHFPEEMSLIHLTKCTDFASTARRILEHLEGLQARQDQRRSSNRVHPNPDASSPSTAARLETTPINATTDEVKEIVADDTLQASESKSNSGRELENLQQLQKKLMELVNQSEQSGCLHRARQPRRKRRRNPGASGEAIGLVIDGPSLLHALHPAVRTVFLDLCMNVTTVLCCRMTPLQKASIVQMVHLGLAGSGGSKAAPVTAAVGDGGNDAAMILQANVGIGIYGKEGREAVFAADYAVPQFRCLKRLILVHGHLFYHRVSSTMLLFYEKCVLFVTVQLLLAFYSGFTAVSWFETIYYILYNLSMTAFCYMGYGIFEKIHTVNELLTYPQLYLVISHQQNLSWKYIALHVVNGIWEGVVVFFAVYLTLHGTEDYSPAIFMDPAKDTVDVFDFTLVGASCYVYTVFVANLRLFTYTRDFNLACGIAIVATIVFNLIFLLVLQVVVDPFNYHYGTYYKVGQSLNFWLTAPVTLYGALFPSLTWRIISDLWWEKQFQIYSKHSVGSINSDNSTLSEEDDVSYSPGPIIRSTRL